MNIAPTETRGVFSSVDYKRVSNTPQYKPAEKPVNEWPPKDIGVVLRTITGNRFGKEQLKERADSLKESPLGEIVDMFGPFFDKNSGRHYILVRDGDVYKPMYYSEAAPEKHYLGSKVDINV